MNFLIFELNVSSYKVKKISGTPMKTLAWFLIYDVGCNFDNWIKEWVINSNDAITGINSSTIEKCGDKIFITSDIYEDFDELELSKKGFLDLIDNWNRLCEQKPKEIVVIYQKGSISFDTNDDKSKDKIGQ